MYLFAKHRVLCQHPCYGWCLAPPVLASSIVLERLSSELTLNLLKWCSSLAGHCGYTLHGTSASVVV